MKIEGMTGEMVEGLCQKWGYSETVRIKEPFDDNGVEVMIDKTVPNPQSKEDFVKEYVINFIVNEYRIEVRREGNEVMEKDAEKKVKKAKLK